LPLVANIYAIFNPLTGGTHHLTIVMYLPQWAQNSTYLDPFFHLCLVLKIWNIFVCN
jgi:hypothetical protein